MMQRWVRILLFVVLCSFGLGFTFAWEKAVSQGLRESGAAEITLPVAQVVWEYQDPTGDDYGFGQYTYPTHSSFAQPGLFDLTALRIWDWGDVWLVDVELSEAKPAWPTPEGFLHQLVDIYLDVVPGAGIREPMIADGPNVEFVPGFAWEYRIKFAPWSKSALYGADGASTPLEPKLLPDGQTIRASISKQLVQGITSETKIIAWVGGYHSLGPDHYRIVDPTKSTWHFGGVENSRNLPNIIDLLAPASGQFTQEQQLAVGSGEQVATLHPVAALTQQDWRPWSFVIFAVSLLLLVAGGVVYKRREAKA